MKSISAYKNEPTRKTPWVVLDEGRIFMMGRSIPENPGEFYRPVHDWIKKYVSHGSGQVKIDLGFEYINTSSIKWVFTLLRELSSFEEVGENATVNWYYDHGDEDTAELGFILRSLIDCPFVVTELDGMSRSKYESILNNGDS
jgi:hypothetical protein